MSTATLEDVDRDVARITEPGKPDCAHILRDVDPERDDIATVMMEARINGTPLTALCGYVFVPKRPAKGLPVCSECRDIFENLVDDEDKSVPDER